MEWSQVLAILAGNAAIVVPLFFWNRSEANSDRRDLMNAMRTNQDNTNNMIRAIHEEIKEFHARLCIIEERNKK